MKNVRKLDREVYRIRQELDQVNAEYAQNVIDIAESANARKIQLEEDYYNKTKEINDRLKADIKSVNDEYEDAVKSRADSLYKSYGLFDNVGKQPTVSGKQLIRNLQAQTTEFSTWQTNINTLCKRCKR